MIKQRIADGAAKVAKRLGHDPRLKWKDAQSFELHHAIEYMKVHPLFAAAIERLDDPSCYLSNGYVDTHILNEFFGDDVADYKKFVTSITGKSVLDIGPCIFTPTSLWDVASERVIVEPLYDQVTQYQLGTLGQNYFRHIDNVYSLGAENYIPELVGRVDGAVLVRNCIDHSPHWPFILANISAYAAPGSTLLLWNDLMHPPEYLDGHYDIADDAGAFRRLIEALGFRIEYEFELHNTNCLDYGCRATRI